MFLPLNDGHDGQCSSHDGQCSSHDGQCSGHDHGQCSSHDGQCSSHNRYFLTYKFRDTHVSFINAFRS